MRGIPLQYVELSNQEREALFKIPSADGHHAVERDLRPVLVIA